MWRRLRIKNYQSLRDVDLPLGHFTVIVGESNSGKSAVVRAVNALLTNETGDAFLPPGAVRAEVCVEFDEHEIWWLKGKSPVYRINGQELARFGAAVPEAILEAVRIREIQVDERTRIMANIHQQFESPFLLRVPGTLVAKVLGELTNVNLLFLAGREAKNRGAEQEKLRKIRESDLEGVKGKLRAYAGLPAELERVKAAQKVLGEVGDLVTAWRRMGELARWVQVLLEKGGGLEEQVNVLGRQVSALAVVDDIAPDVEFVDRGRRVVGLYESKSVLRAGLENRVNMLASELEGLEAVDEAGQLLAEMEKGRELARRWEGLEARKVALVAVAERCRSLAELDTSDLEVELAELARGQELAGRMESLRHKLVIAEQAVADKEMRLRVAEEELAEFIRENPRCPLCGAELREGGAA